jgi:hypothetical protein
MPANKPLQQPPAPPILPNAGSCRDAAGYAHGSSRRGTLTGDLGGRS